MWFHLLSVAAFLALGSCLDSYGFSRKHNTSDCQGLGCSCDCPHHSCAPCPIPEPFECLSGCGTPECPCVNPNHKNGRSNRAQVDAHKEKMINMPFYVSTVNVKPTGPICSASNLLPRVMMTVSTCIEGIALEDLYVTVVVDNGFSGGYFLKRESLKVTEIIYYPFYDGKPSPVALITKEPSANVITLKIPARPIDMGRAMVQKWYIENYGTVYIPLDTEAKSYSKCKTVEDLICAETFNTVVMGWNDIGSVLVEPRDDSGWVQGIYIGNNLYEPTTTIMYIPVYMYEEWLYSVVKKYS